MTAERQMPHEVADYLRLHHVITMSTSSFTGMPHADTVVYANDENRIYFFAPGGSNLARNIADSRYVSFTIDDYTTDWRKVRELQGVCGCRPAEPGEREWALGLWFGKYGSANPLGDMYALLPREMHFVDYDYATVSGEAEITSRDFQIAEAQVPVSAPVATTLDESRFDAGQVIFRPGDRTGQYFVVLEGEVEIRGEGHGSDQTVTRVGPGQMFGDQAALRGMRGALTAHAVTPTRLLAVQREAIRDLLLPSTDQPTWDETPQ